MTNGGDIEANKTLMSYLIFIGYRDKTRVIANIIKAASMRYIECAWPLYLKHAKILAILNSIKLKRNLKEISLSKCTW